MADAEAEQGVSFGGQASQLAAVLQRAEQARAQAELHASRAAIAARAADRSARHSRRGLVLAGMMAIAAVATAIVVSRF